MIRLRVCVACVSWAAFVLFIVGSVWLAQLEQGGPPRTELLLSGEIPATLYLPPPRSRDGSSAFLEPPPQGARPPVVVLAHGLCADRANMSGIARRLATSGYAALSLDLRGHGANRHPFPGFWGRPDALSDDLLAAVEFVAASPLVDGSRIALLGHSMGAGAVLDYVTRDARPNAAVLISGGWTTFGPIPPRNTLFIYADADVPHVVRRAEELTARLANVVQPLPATTYGDFRRGSAVRRIEVPGVNHVSILWSDAAVAETLTWLDAALQYDRRQELTQDPRPPVVTMLAGLVVAVLPGLGLLVGGLTPRAVWPSSSRLEGLGLFAVALLAALPLATPGGPGAILIVDVGDVVIVQFAVAGIGLLVLSHRRDPAAFASLWVSPGRSLVSALVGIVGVYTLMQPFGTCVHRISLTPERMGAFLLAMLGFLPLALAAQSLLRRGRPPSATMFSLAGRLVIVSVLFMGMALGIVPFVVSLLLPGLVVVFLLQEVLATAIYAASGNLLAIALIDAAWLALVVSAILPIRV